MADTALDLIKTALRQISAIASGEAPTADEGADALVILNDMLAMWSATGLLVPAETVASGALVVGQASYTIGATGDWTNARPIEITAAFIRDGTTDFHLSRATSRTWAGVPDKQTNAPARVFWYNPTMPDGTLYLDLPSDTTNTLYYTAIAPISSFASLSTTYALAPEQRMAIWSNLALLLAPEYEREPSQMLFATAESSRRTLEARAASNRAPVASTEFMGAVQGWYDIDRGF